MLRGTHTYVTLDVSEATFLEIKSKLTLAGYDHVFSVKGGKALIDMDGLALQMSERPKPLIDPTRIYQTDEGPMTLDQLAELRIEQGYDKYPELRVSRNRNAA